MLLIPKSRKFLGGRFCRYPPPVKSSYKAYPYTIAASPYTQMQLGFTRMDPPHIEFYFDIIKVRNI